MLVFLAFCVVALAKEPAKFAPPAAPIVAAVPENAEWTVTAKEFSLEKGKKGRAPGPALQISEVRSTKVGPLKRDVVTSADGSTREVWFAEHFLIWKTENGEISVSDFSAAPAPDPADPNPSVATGFPGVAWISLETFSDVETFNGEPCYHYVQEANEAWISVKTKLPAGYKSGTTTYLYKFSPPPKSSPEMPPAYKSALEKASQLRPQASP